MSLRDIFVERVRDRLYEYLKSGALRDWDFDQRFRFAGLVIKENQEKINAYFKEKNVTLANINEAVEDIVRNVLLPSIRIK